MALSSTRELKVKDCNSKRSSGLISSRNPFRREARFNNLSTSEVRNGAQFSATIMARIIPAYSLLLMRFLTQSRCFSLHVHSILFPVLERKGPAATTALTNGCKSEVRLFAVSQFTDLVRPQFVLNGGRKFCGASRSFHGKCMSLRHIVVSILQFSCSGASARVYKSGIF